jgi:hypothetical protein
MYDHHSDRWETESESSWFIDSTASARLISISSNQDIIQFNTTTQSSSVRLGVTIQKDTQMPPKPATSSLVLAFVVRAALPEYHAATREAVIEMSVMPIGRISAQVQSRTPSNEQQIRELRPLRLLRVENICRLRIERALQVYGPNRKLEIVGASMLPLNILHTRRWGCRLDVSISWMRVTGFCCIGYSALLLRSTLRYRHTFMGERLL